MSLCIGAQTLMGIVATGAIGMVTPDEIKSYVMVNHQIGDKNEQFNFGEPMGGFGIEYDIHKHVRLFAEHLSSPTQCDDFPGVNHAGVKVMAPLTKDLTVYSGISVNESTFDSNDDFAGPLGSLGVEYGDDIKVFAEHLSSIHDFKTGRTSVGIKVFFK